MKGTELTRQKFIEEERFVKDGFPVVVGIDEAGRGSLAGPVVAAAVIVTARSRFTRMNLRDSKLMREKKREEVFETLSSMGGVKWGIGTVSSKTVDRVNVLEATKIAMRKALSNLKKKGFPASAAIIDGNFLIGSGLPERPIIKGDETVVSCKIAGIVAKVTRDRMMRRASKVYPGYHFERHKGYCTKLHLEAIRKSGFCLIHRRSFVVKRRT